MSIIFNTLHNVWYIAIQWTTNSEQNIGNCAGGEPPARFPVVHMDLLKLKFLPLGKMNFSTVGCPIWPDICPSLAVIYVLRWPLNLTRLDGNLHACWSMAITDANSVRIVYSFIEAPPCLRQSHPRGFVFLHQAYCFWPTCQQIGLFFAQVRGISSTYF